MTSFWIHIEAFSFSAAIAHPDDEASPPAPQPHASCGTAGEPGASQPLLALGAHGMRRHHHSTWQMTADGPATIVGLGRIGSLLASAGGGQDAQVGRGDTIDAGGSGPIYVCTRNDVLDDIVDKCPENRREDLVFLQNGFIESWLKSRGLEANTQALLYFAVPKLGAEPIDGVTPLNPEGLTTVTGKWGQALADRLAKAGLKCNDVDDM
eukprot:scaffold368_cov258-Pinguiococcus_pyrenoidosus.AAC.24